MTDPSSGTYAPTRTPARQVRTMAVTAGALVLLLAGLFLWRDLRNQPPAFSAPPPVAVAATVVKPQTVPASLDAVGTLRAVREVILAPEVPGRVSAIHFDAGARVREGVLLVQLFDGPERADRKAAAARAAFARVQLGHSEQLAPTGAEPRELLQQRRAEHDQALAAVQQLDARLAQKQVRAPFAGVIGIRRIDPGQYLNAGDQIATLTALDSLYVEFALPQQELARIRTGGAVTIHSDAWPGRTFAARVNAVEPRIGEDTRNILIQATVPNPDAALRPGMYVTASLQLPPQQDALVVPATAILTSAQGDSVIVVRGENPRAGGKAEIVPVQTGRRPGNRVIVTDGLQPGDVVVTEGQLRVQPDAAVQVSRLLPSGAD